MALRINSFVHRPLIVAAAVLAAALTLTAPAAAAVTGLHEETEPSLYNSDRSKTVTVTCQTGTVIGGGGSIFNGGAKVAIEAVVPDVSAGTLTVTAKETDDYVGYWSVTARAMCAPAPPGLVRVRHWSAKDSGDKTMDTSCPDDKTLLSVGWDIGDGWGEVLVNETNLIATVGSPATGVSMSAREDDNYTGDWTLQTYVVCADPIAGQQWVSSVTTANSDPYTPGEADCPSGQNATGGAAMAVSLNAATQSELDITWAFSYDATATLDSFWTTAYEEDPIGDSWYLVTYGLCA